MNYENFRTETRALCLTAGLAIAGGLSAGCATIPKESAKLNENLGTMISRSRSGNRILSLLSIVYNI